MYKDYIWQRISITFQFTCILLRLTGISYEGRLWIQTNCLLWDLEILKRLLQTRALVSFLRKRVSAYSIHPLLQVESITTILKTSRNEKITSLFSQWQLFLNTQSMVIGENNWFVLKLMWSVISNSLLQNNLVFFQAFFFRVLSTEDYFFSWSLLNAQRYVGIQQK